MSPGKTMQAISITKDHAIRIVETAMGLVEKTGVLVQVGVHDEDATVAFNPFRIYERELRIIGSNSCAHKYPAAVEMMSEVRARAAHLVGQSCSVRDFGKAIDGMATGHSIKTLLHFNN